MQPNPYSLCARELESVTSSFVHEFSMVPPPGRNASMCAETTRLHRQALGQCTGQPQHARVRRRDQRRAGRAFGADRTVYAAAHDVCAPDITLPHPQLDDPVHPPLLRGVRVADCCLSVRLHRLPGHCVCHRSPAGQVARAHSSPDGAARGHAGAAGIRLCGVAARGRYAGPATGTGPGR